ncbi:unnamed protein product [Rangifer tarandus platyrhynchus]|uniref:Uncharacterized protein n=1 Tax=Rangifer tarandus platyrhynchus TaxID=3082113 RepID=A0AC59Z3M1_RANTA
MNLRTICLFRSHEASLGEPPPFCHDHPLPLPPGQPWLFQMGSSSGSRTQSYGFPTTGQQDVARGQLVWACSGADFKPAGGTPAPDSDHKAGTRGGGGVRTKASAPIPRWLNLEAAVPPGLTPAPELPPRRRAEAHSEP